jgi:hypothetical protein
MDARARIAIGLLAATLAGACRVSIADPPKPAPTRKHASVKARASASPTPAATDEGRPMRLRRPDGPVQVLRGSVRIDATYALGAGSLVSDAGGGLISDNGGAVLALADIGLLSNNSGNLVSDQGGNIISDHASGIISDHASGIVANNSGGRVSNTMGALLQAPATALGPGEVLPAAGMVVRARSLADGKPLALGVDATGAEVFTIRTDAKGAYEVYVPAAIAGNVVVTAEVPKSADPRLRYDLLVPVAATEARGIDEDTSLVSRYQRQGYLNLLVDILVAPDIDALTTAYESYDNVPVAVRSLMIAFAREFRAAGDAAGLTREPRARIEAVAGRVADAFMARVDFDAVEITEGALPITGPGRTDAERLLGTRTIPLGVRLLRLVRERAAVIRADRPTFPAGDPWFEEANAALRAAGKPAIEIKRPSDVGLFIVDAFLTGGNARAYEDLARAMHAMLLDDDPETGVKISNALATLNTATALAAGAVMFGDPDAKDAAFRELAAWREVAGGP